MSIIIEDGLGKGFKTGVSSDGRLLTNAEVQSEMHFHSTEEQLSFTWNSTFATGGTGVEVISIKNTDNEKLHIHGISLGAAAASVFTVFEVTSGTAAGTTVTPTNLFLGSGNTRDNTSFGNAAVTGSLAGNTLYQVAVEAGDSRIMDIEGGLVIPKGSEIAITSSANTTVYVTAWGHWGE